MALDWNKNISLSTILDLVKKGDKGGKKASSEMPTKTTMNLIETEQSSSDVRKKVLIGILAAVVLIAFVKFGILDPFATLRTKQAELERQQAALAEMMGADGDYQDVAKLYEAYTKQYGNGSADAISLLDMVDQRVRPVAKVTQIVFADNTLTLTVEGASLQTVGDLASNLEKDPMVASTVVKSSETQQSASSTTVSTIVVVLEKPASTAKE